MASLRVPDPSRFAIRLCLMAHRVISTRSIVACRPLVRTSGRRERVAQTRGLAAKDRDSTQQARVYIE